MHTFPIRIHIIVAFEIGSLLASIVLGALWISEPSGPYEPYLVVAGLVLVLTEAYRRYEGRLFPVEGVNRTPSERIHHHETLRAQFTEEIADTRARKLRKDAIIRHVNRLNDYPNVKDSPGISPWFRVGLLDTYHMGIRVALGYHGLVEYNDGFRRVDYSKNESSDVTAMLIGEIPYDNIESINREGDEYYSFPHIFCHFSNRGEPYQRLYFAQELDMGHGQSYWKEIASHEGVLHASSKS